LERIFFRPSISSDEVFNAFANATIKAA